MSQPRQTGHRTCPADLFAGYVAGVVRLETLRGLSMTQNCYCRSGRRLAFQSRGPGPEQGSVCKHPMSSAGLSALIENGTVLSQGMRYDSILRFEEPAESLPEYVSVLVTITIRSVRSTELMR